MQSNDIMVSAVVVRRVRRRLRPDAVNPLLLLFGLPSLPSCNGFGRSHAVVVACGDRIFPIMVISAGIVLVLFNDLLE